MVLWPVELNAPRDPGTEQTDQRRFDDLIVIDKIALFDLIKRLLYTPAQFRKDHDFQIVIFQPDRLPRFLCFAVAQRIGHPVGVDGPR